VRYRSRVGVSGMDHPMIGAERFEAVRRTAYVPPISVGGRAVNERLDRHLAVLVPEGADPARSGGRGLPTGEPARLGAAQTVQLLREISPRPAAVPRRRLSLRAPLRSFKRWIGF
jgi:hypothetical protein